jgi:hypothetical protein
MNQSGVISHAAKKAKKIAVCALSSSTHFLFPLIDIGIGDGVFIFCGGVHDTCKKVVVDTVV